MKEIKRYTTCDPANKGLILEYCKQLIGIHLYEWEAVKKKMDEAFEIKKSTILMRYMNLEAHDLTTPGL